MSDVTTPARPIRHGLMHPIRWIPDGAMSLLDVGCNVGAFLKHAQQEYPHLRLAGVEINLDALAKARLALPGVELHANGIQDLPFEDESFDCVTCMEVLEHVPTDLRRDGLAEIRRVLRPGGRLILSVPHAGAFAFLDPNNFRFNLPWLYRRTVGRGIRDQGYEHSQGEVVWHHHFTRAEFLDLAGPGWEVEKVRTGGLFLSPLMDIARNPFYRLDRTDHPLCRLFARIAEFDHHCSIYGSAGSGILFILRKSP